ncbi:MAG: MFS transporter [Erysipelotrichales bacterium]|nr:MFS transporter [Erysipelotrichales bacterium]
MKNLQMKYNLLHILYWITSLTIYGYIAIFLQYKGLTNTQIGIVSGLGAFLSIFISPFISSLLEKVKGLTIKKLTFQLYILMFIVFAILTFIDLPLIFIMILYISLLCLIVSVVPFLSMICMNYLKSGEYIDFGLARGMGSVAYAIGAVVVSQLISMINPSILSYVHLISSSLMLWILFSMPNSEIATSEKQEKGSSAFGIIQKYRTFFFILLGFAFMLGASQTISTYLINIVTRLGGNTSLYGIAIFCMAASEMPVMAKTYQLMKKFNGETLILASTLFYVVRNFTICFAPNLIVLLIGMMFQGISYGLFTATIAYYVNDHLKAEDQMMGQTMIGMMSTGLGATIGNVVGGYLQDTFGINSMFTFVCIMTIIGFVVMYLTLHKKVKLRKVS